MSDISDCVRNDGSRAKASRRSINFFMKLADIRGIMQPLNKLNEDSESLTARVSPMLAEKNWQINRLYLLKTTLSAVRF